MQARTNFCLTSGFIALECIVAALLISICLLTSIPQLSFLNSAAGRRTQIDLLVLELRELNIKSTQLEEDISVDISQHQLTIYSKSKSYLRTINLKKELTLAPIGQKVISFYPNLLASPATINIHHRSGYSCRLTVSLRGRVTYSCQS